MEANNGKLTGRSESYLVGAPRVGLQQPTQVLQAVVEIASDSVVRPVYPGLQCDAHLDNACTHGQ